MIRVRFAASPTGYLHLSGALVALANVLHARRHGGHVLLRLDDIDRERSRPAFADAIAHDLRWLGLAWDDQVRQSDRLALYAEAAEQLKRTERLYPCFETEQELRAKREFRLRRGQAAIYDRAMLKLTPAQRLAAEAHGKRPHWRFRLSDGTVAWRDLVLGPRQASLSAVSDPVLVRADGTPTSVLASVVDDIRCEITHVIRAEDSAANTAIQVDLLAALGADPARLQFAHLPPPGDRGHGRFGNPSLRSLRHDGVDPRAIVAFLAGPGLDGAVRPATAEQLAPRFDLVRLVRAGARSDASRLLALNRQALGALDFAAVADRLPNGATEAFWLAIRGSLDLLNEARGWWDVVAGTIVPPVIEGERAFLLLAADLLPPEPWDASVWAAWTTALAEATGRSGDALAQPLRLALTGEEHGPDLADLLPLIGRVRATNRLQIAAA